MSARAAGLLLVPLVACSSLATPFVPDAQISCAEQIDAAPPCPIGDDLGILGTLAPDELLRGSDGTTVLSLPLCAHRLSVQLYPGHGQLAHGLVTQAYDVSGDELSMATCGVCLRLFIDTDAHGAPTRTYMATSGTLHVNQVGTVGAEDFFASLENVTFQEVTIDAVTFETTVTGSCITKITSVDVKAPVSPLR